MATISDDLFTTADGAVLSGRTSTGGQTWTKKAIDLGDFTVFSNKIYWNHASGYDIIHLSGNATTDGEYAEAVWDVKTLIGLVGIGLRFSPGANVGYFLGYASSASTWRLYRFDGGFTVLASGGSAPGTGTRTVRLTATGTGASVTLRCQLDGADIFSPYVDSSASRITTLGRLMIYGDTLASSTTGIHIDSVKLEDGAGVAAPVLSSPTASATGVSGQVQIGVSIDTVAGATLKSLQRLTASPAADAATILASGVTRALGGSPGAQGPYTVTGLTDGVSYSWDWAATNGSNSNVVTSTATPFTSSGGVKVPTVLLSRLLTPRS